MTVLIFVYRGSQITVNLKTVTVHNADSGEVLYEESRRRLHEPSHSVLTLTITAL